MGKWRADTLATLANPVYRLVVRTAHEARAPLRHFFRLLKKSAVARAPDGLGTMARLVFGKAGQSAG
eukprot:3555348-Alexandrium_andersonii.AAC.1